MYILEGNIGAGKTTFLRLLEKAMPDISVGYEPVDDWQHKVHGQSLLANFYTNPHRWAYSMETFTMLSRVRDHLRDQEWHSPKRIIERSIYSGYYCFALNSFRSNFLTPLEWHMYCAWFTFLIPGKCKPPKGFIYLRVNPEIAYDRIKKRSRSAESTIPLAYLQQIHQGHEAFLIEKKDVLSDIKNTPVLVLDCNQDFENDPAVFKNMVQQVKAFIEQTL